MPLYAADPNTSWEADGAPKHPRLPGPALLCPGQAALRTGHLLGQLRLSIPDGSRTRRGALAAMSPLHR